MRRVLCLLVIIMATTTAMAQRGQDFASRFVQQCRQDTALECITISPKMMEQLLTMGGDSRNEQLMQPIAKLKSARNVQASTRGAHYYQLAEELLKKNARRFRYVKNFRTEHSTGVFYNRQARNGDTVELVMLCQTVESDKFVLINLTGDIDEEFVEMLSQLFGQRASHAPDE